MKSFKIVNALGVLTLAIALSSCGNSASKEENKDSSASTDMAEKQNDAKFSKADQKDADFVLEATIINMQEIQVSKYAAEHAMSDDTKNLAKMMVQDHEKSLGEVTALAASKGISVPANLSDDDQKDAKKLMDEKPKNLDKSYCDMMVDDHKKAIDKFEKASNDSADPDIKLWALNTLSVLRQHLDHAMVSQEKAEKAKK